MNTDTTTPADTAAELAAADGDHNPHVEIFAAVTDRNGHTEHVYAGQQPIAGAVWTNPDWRRTYRRTILAELTTDPRGYRVKFVPDFDGTISASYWP